MCEKTARRQEDEPMEMETDGPAPEELYYSLLAGIKGFGERELKLLCGPGQGAAEAFYAQIPQEAASGKRGWEKLKELKVFREELLRRFKTPRGIEQWRRHELSELGKRGIRFYSRIDPAFPERLKRIPDPPLGLFCRGELLPAGPSIAMVGARACSGYGARMAEEFAEAFARAGLTVISGMARGIDGIAQRSALKAGGKSIGVLGCGPDICYPPENRDVFEALPLSGGVVSEYPPGTPPLGIHFPRRNRLISGLADALLVLEARRKSGTLITVDMALEQGRDVYVLPGRVTDPLSVGCNRLIREGAMLVQEPEQILKDMGLIPGKRNAAVKTPVFREELFRQIYEAVDIQPTAQSEVAVSLKSKGVSLSHGELAKKLAHLVMDGLLRSPVPGFFERC